MKEGLNLILLSAKDGIPLPLEEFNRLERIEQNFYNRDRNAAPDWYIQAMKRALLAQKDAFLKANPQLAILQVILPKPTHPLLLNDPPKPLGELDICSADLIQSQSLRQQAKQNGFSLQTQPLIDNRSLRALHAVANDPITTETSPERAQLLWTHRKFASQRLPGLLLPFIQSVQWWLIATDREEIDEALQLVKEWKMHRDAERRFELAGQLICGWQALATDVPEWIELLEQLVAKEDEKRFCLQWMAAIIDARKRDPKSQISQRLSKMIVQSAAEDVDFACTVYWHDKSLFDEFTIEAQSAIKKQESLFSLLNSLLEQVERRKGTRLQKIELIRHLLGDPDQGVLQKIHEGVRLPGCSSVTCALAVNQVSLFKSTALAAFLPFLVEGSNGSPLPYPLIYKRGDDLNRDAAVLRIFRQITHWWRTEAALDLIPDSLFYAVLPTGKSSGLVQFVESKPISALLESERSRDENRREFALLNYLQSLPDPQTSLANFMDTCVGYSMLTFVLGVGDRHLDNLLITPRGQLLHIDFAFLFGDDPKPFAPPIKLSREMVRAVSDWQAFKAKMFTAFGVLRGRLGALQSLVQSEFDSQAARFVWERLAGGLEEGEALQRLDSLVEESRSALFPQVLETIHQWAQYWKS